MSFSEEPIIPTDPEQPPQAETAAQRVRRRRATRRQMIPVNTEGQAALISSLARRAYPSIELFIFSLLCGAILGLGFLLDSQAVLLLGILLAPLMTPWVGFLLAILTGNPRFLFETLMALLISVFLVFIGGLITGFASRLFLPITLSNVFIHARLWVPVLIVLVVGAVTLVASFVRSESRPYLPSLIIAYAFFLPVNATAFGLGAGLPDVWPNGLFVFATHFILAGTFGLITLFVLKLRPTSNGMIASGAIGILFVLALFNLLKPNIPPTNDPLAAFTPTNPPTSLLSPTSNAVSTSTVTVLLPQTSTPNSVDFTETVAVALTQVAQTRNAPTSTPTPNSPTPVPLTLAITLPASQTPTVTMTIEIEPVSGRISASEGGGANLRQTPNGKFLMTLDNGEIVDIYPDFKQVNGVTWLHVFATRNSQRVEGWLLESVVTYATPAPNFEPSSTPQP
jgi:hypothetical protein